MSTAEPRPSTPAHPPEDSGRIDGTSPAIENGSVSDARRRGRSRRTGYALIAAAFTLALVGIAFVDLGGRNGAPAGTPEPDEPGMPFAPVNVAPPQVVGAWARIHEGWIYVYDDGRVLSHADFGPILERRLSPRGLDLVRRGTLAPQDLQVHVGMTTVPAEVWSDPIPDAYRSDRYAVCKLNVEGTPEDRDVLGDVGSIWRRLPADVQALFRAGRMKSFTDESVDETGDVIGPDGHHGEPGPGFDCFVLSPVQTRAVWVHTRAPEGAREVDGELLMGDATFAEPIWVADSDYLFVAVPLLPHGGWVLWGG
jgi:hypothetical protein